MNQGPTIGGKKKTGCDGPEYQEHLGFVPGSYLRRRAMSNSPAV
jgi:hypothetical protein